MRWLKSPCLAVLVLAAAGCAGPIKSERLDTLLELKKDDEQLADTLKQQTEHFEAVRKALDTGEIKKGDLKSTVAEKAGDPVITYPEKNGEKWLYKETGKGWFAAPKIYLFFDSDGRLSDYQCLRVDCRASP